MGWESKTRAGDVKNGAVLASSVPVHYFGYPISRRDLLRLSIAAGAASSRGLEGAEADRVCPMAAYAASGLEELAEARCIEGGLNARSA